MVSVARNYLIIRNNQDFFTQYLFYYLFWLHAKLILEQNKYFLSYESSNEKTRYIIIEYITK